MIKIRTPARAGILGNPSDGFYGKTLAVPIRNFYAEVELSESNEIEILPGPRDKINFKSMNEIIEDIKTSGYYGGFRLIKAAIKQFYDYLNFKGIDIPNKNFTARYRSTIPRQVGLAGSSAIIASMIKALLKFYNIEMEKAILANYVLWAETKELSIAAGLQDRVVQVYNAPIYMDFNEAFMKKYGFGIYEPVDRDLFPPFYLAYQIDLTHKEHIHNDIKIRWERKDPLIRETMIKIGENAREGYNALNAGELETFDRFIDRNFDLRASIYPLAKKNVQMITLARSVGATAKFPGSGGAIIGTYKNETMFEKLTQEFNRIGCSIIKIEI